jgi:hypothetical protein
MQYNPTLPLVLRDFEDKFKKEITSYLLPLWWIYMGSIYLKGLLIVNLN